MWYQDEGIFQMGEGHDYSGDGDTIYQGRPGETDINADGIEDGEEGWNLRLGEDVYATIGYDLLGNPLPVNVSEPVLYGQSYDSPNDGQKAEIRVTWDPTNSQGTQNSFIQLISDPNWSWQPNPANPDYYFERIFPYNMALSDDYGMEAHLQLHASARAATEYGWSLTATHSTGVYGSVVPEPVTMISLALSGMGLVGYIRKRRNK